MFSAAESSIDSHLKIFETVQSGLFVQFQHQQIALKSLANKLDAKQLFF